MTEFKICRQIQFCFHQINTENYTQLALAAWEYIKLNLTHFKHLPSIWSLCCYESLPSTATFLTFPLISETLFPSLHNESQAAILPAPLLPANFRFFQVRCHIYCSICVFLNHSTCVKLGHSFYQVPILFLCVADVVHLTSQFPTCPMIYIGRYCIAQQFLGMQISHYRRIICGIQITAFLNSIVI